MFSFPLPSACRSALLIVAAPAPIDFAPFEKQRSRIQHSRHAFSFTPNIVPSILEIANYIIIRGITDNQREWESYRNSTNRSPTLLVASSVFLSEGTEDLPDYRVPPSLNRFPRAPPLMPYFPATSPRQLHKYLFVRFDHFLPTRRDRAWCTHSGVKE